MFFLLLLKAQTVYSDENGVPVLEESVDALYIDRTEENYKTLMEKTDNEKTQREIEEDIKKLETLKNSYKKCKKYLTLIKDTPIDD